MAEHALFNIEKIAARLDLDRDRITGLLAAAELMRNHADEHEREASNVAKQLENFIALTSDRLPPAQRREFRALLTAKGLAAPVREDGD